MTSIPDEELNALELALAVAVGELLERGGEFPVHLQCIYADGFCAVADLAEDREQLVDLMAPSEAAPTWLTATDLTGLVFNVEIAYEGAKP